MPVLTSLWDEEIVAPNMKFKSFLAVTRTTFGGRLTRC